MSKPLRLLDNSGYVEKLEDLSESDIRKKWVSLLDFRPKANAISFLRHLSANTIGQLLADDGSDILVWPQSFSECHGDLKDMKVVQYDGNIYQTGNLVGFIGNGKVQLEITSRFFDGSRESDNFLYYMLSRQCRLNVLNMEVGKGNVSALDLQMFMFPRFFKEAMRQGMFKKYIRKEYNDANVRGVISVNRHIRGNYPENGRIAYSTREFSYDNELTQLIRHTIEYMDSTPIGRALLHMDQDVESYVRHIIQHTPNYRKNERHKVIADNRIPVTHPYFTAYRPLQRLCMSILRNDRMSYGFDDVKVRGVLIDVAWLWEEYMADILTEVGFVHHTQQDGFKLFNDTNSNHSFQTVIPDYVYTDENGNSIVSDAKYIPLHRYKQMSAEKAGAVYYKTIMYMYRFATDIGYLLHPCSRADVDGAGASGHVTYADYEIANGRDCHLYEIGLVVPDETNFKNFCICMQEAENTFKETITNTTILWQKN